MFDRLILEVKLGNAQMQTPTEVATALRTAADQIETHRLHALIFDANGNAVGDWKFE